MNNIYKNASRICENNMDEVKSAIKRIIEMGYLAKNEGLLALEVFVEQEEKYPEMKFVSKATSYIVDGRSWEQVNRFLENRILMMEDVKKQYLCLLYKECIEQIQKDMFLYLRKDVILSLIPEKYQSEISEYIDQMEDKEYEKWNAKKNLRIDEEYAKIAITFSTELKEEMTLFEIAADLKEKSRFTQKWLRYMDCNDVYYLMLAGSEAFKEVILSNMSSRMKQMAKEEVVNLVKIWNAGSEDKVRNAISRGIATLNEI